MPLLIWYFIRSVVIWPGGRSLSLARGIQFDLDSVFDGPTAVTVAIPPSAIATPAPSTTTPAWRRNVARSIFDSSAGGAGDAGLAATGFANCVSETRWMYLMARVGLIPLGQTSVQFAS